MGEAQQSKPTQTADAIKAVVSAGIGIAATSAANGLAPDRLSAILHGGSFALLTWLIVVVAPRMMRESREEREKRDANFSRAMTDQSAAFEQRSKLIADAITNTIRDENRITREALRSVCKSIAHQNGA